MTLSSQSARSSRPGPRTRGKKGPPWRAIFVLIAVAAGGYFLFLRGEDAPAPEAPLAAAPAPEVGTAPAATPEEASGGGGVPASSSPRPSPRPSTATTLLRPGVPAVAETPPAPAATPQPAATPPAPPAQAAAPPAAPVLTSRVATGTLDEGFALLDAGQRVAGRNLLSSLLLESDEPLSPDDATRVRNRLTEANRAMVFSPTAVPGDNLTTLYEVQPGDLLGSIAVRAKVPYPLLEMMNQTRAERMQVGQTLKLLRGPVHARVSKTDFTMDLYAFGEDGNPVFLGALPVGLGANDGTPLGRWRVGRSKVVNPSWKNPRTGQYHAADDPDIPIGEYWIPIEGLEGDSVGRSGFGIHGTNEPDSIGSMQSMGCIRLNDADVELVYHMLEPRDSEVVIVP